MKPLLLRHRPSLLQPPVATHEIGEVTTFRDAIQDCLFLSLVVVFSLVLYVQGLGFYYDDWAFLRWLSTAQDQSLAGLYRALYAGEVNPRQRPVQILYMAGLY